MSSEFKHQSTTNIPTLSRLNKMPQPRQKSYVLFITAFPLLLHAISVAATICFVLVYLDERNFGVNRRDGYVDVQQAGGEAITRAKRWIPLQTDMIVTLSAMIVITRFFLMSWSADVAWKCIFILLELTGLSVSQISNLVKYRLLLGSGLPNSHIPGGVQFNHVLIALVLLLPFPAYLSAPLITGSITWTPSYELLQSVPLNGVATFSNSFHWTWYQSEEVHRIGVLLQASKYHNLFYSSSRDSSLKRSLVAAIARSLADNSTLSNVTMPYISISNLNWISDASQVPPQQLQAINPATYRLNITFFDGLVPKGSLALIPDEPWRPSRSSGNGASLHFEERPKRSISRRFYLAFWPRFQVEPSVTCDNSTFDAPAFSYPTSASAWYTFPSDISIVCYLFAIVDVSAGTKLCNDCPLQRDQVLSANQPHSLENQPLQSDVLVEEVFWMMPQVIDLMVQTGLFLPDQDGLDNYVKTMLTRAYAVSWSALTDFTADGSEGLRTGVDAAVVSTRAVVNYGRLGGWIACQAAVWLAAGIFGIVQRRCKRPLAADSVIAAIFMETNDELRSHARDTGLSDVVVVSPEKHNRELGLLKLDVDTSTGRSQLMEWKPEQTTRGKV